jgi:large subunit ribosomal protein L9
MVFNMFFLGKKYARMVSHSKLGNFMARTKAILLEHIKNHGKAGEVVSMTKGYFRHLKGLKKVSYATPEACRELEAHREVLRQKDEENRVIASEFSQRLSGKEITMINEASDKGVLFGSITSRDVAKALSHDDMIILPTQVMLHTPIKQIGVYNLGIELHPLVRASVVLHVKTQLEAEMDQQEA